MQALTVWPGDVDSLITEMKRRAGVRTDQELARFLGTAQSTVANWRKRGSVPNAALLSFDRAIDQHQEADSERMLAARVLALRLPELYHERLTTRGITRGRQFAYSVIAMSFAAIVAEVARRLALLEVKTDRRPNDLVNELVEDEFFLAQLLDWASEAPAIDLLIQQEAATLHQAAILARRLDRTPLPPRSKERRRSGPDRSTG